MKSILGIGNALTDILAVLPDDTLLKKYNLPPGSMQHVDAPTGNKIWADLKQIGVQYVAGGSAANTISTTAILGMPSTFIGKVGDDELGSLFHAAQKLCVKQTFTLTARSFRQQNKNIPRGPVKHAQDLLSVDITHLIAVNAYIAHPSAGTCIIQQCDHRDPEFIRLIDLF